MFTYINYKEYKAPTIITIYVTKISLSSGGCFALHYSDKCVVKISMCNLSTIIASLQISVFNLANSINTYWFKKNVIPVLRGSLI